MSAVVHSVAALAAVAAAPLDHLGRVEAAPSRVRPAALVLIESELWPLWIAAARRRGTPVVRVSDRSFPRYRKLGCPVLFGPHIADIRHAVEILERCRAGRTVDDAVSLGRAATDWLRDPIAARAWGVEGRLALRSLRGSAERAAHLVDSVLRMHPARAL